MVIFLLASRSDWTPATLKSLAGNYAIRVLPEAFPHAAVAVALRRGPHLYVGIPDVLVSLFEQQELYSGKHGIE